MQVKSRSILQYFWPSLNYYLSLRSLFCLFLSGLFTQVLLYMRERSGSVEECLTWDRWALGSSLTGVTTLCPWARHIYPSLVLAQPRKTCPSITERLLMGRKESNQTNKTVHMLPQWPDHCHHRPEHWGCWSDPPYRSHHLTDYRHHPSNQQLSS